MNLLHILCPVLSIDKVIEGEQTLPEDLSNVDLTKCSTALQSHMKTCSQPLHEDTFGGHLKVGLAQIAAMEITRGNHRDNKAVIRYLPWLYHPPSAMQQG